MTRMCMNLRVHNNNNADSDQLQLYTAPASANMLRCALNLWTLMRENIFGISLFETWYDIIHVISLACCLVLRLYNSQQR